MSVTFSIAGSRSLDMCEEYCGSCAVCNEAVIHSSRTEMNVSNANAADLLAYLVLPVTDELCGAVSARDLRVKATACLSRPVDAALPAVEDGNFIDCGRRAGYLHDRVSHLLRLATEAGDLGRIVWG